MTNDSPPISVADLLRRRGEQVERALDAFLARQTRVPARLMEAVRYSLFAGGKRLRPTLVLEWEAAVTGRDAPTSDALAAAGAIELVHTFSLVHDDLPAMDDDDLRRGRPTSHKAFGEAMAILAGDAMTTLAFEMIAEQADAGVAARLVAELARAAGPAGMIGGQVLDMAGEGRPLTVDELRQVHAMKTGALITAACRLGAVAGGARPEQVDAARCYGDHLGLAFQVMDDVLDVTSTPDQMGKATGKDGDAGKNTYPRLIGLEASVALARSEVDAAVAALDALPAETKVTLAALARFVVDRHS